MSDTYGAVPLKVLAEFLNDLIDEAALRAREKREAKRIRTRKQVGSTLRPGKDTPLWNFLRADVQKLLKVRGEQAKLARILGLHRQSINAFVTSGSRMPDAERTLMILAWLAAAKAGRPLS